MTSFTIAIPTYHRPDLLQLLIEDIARQSVLPGRVIVVDGDPRSAAVLPVLESMQLALPFHIIYIPSNYGNLPYQRYLGWRATQSLPVEYLLYLDDDLRIPQTDAIERVLDALRQEAGAAGATAEIRMGAPGANFAAFQVLTDRPVGLEGRRWLRRLGSSRHTAPGGLTPSGHRVMPDLSAPGGWARVEWLRGGVMAYRMSALSRDCFSEDLFALDHIRCGKGEDTFLSQRVMRRGRLLYVKGARFEHPNADTPKTYPVTAYRFGYSSAYSRRFLNDHYRIDRPPRLSDRLELLKSYLGNNLIQLARAVARPRRHRWAYAWGYLVGSLRGLLQKPTARNLTPQIDWWQDAEATLAETVVLS